MIDMTLEIAETAVRAAQAKARALRAPMTVTVVDEAGRLVLSARGDGTGFFSPETSRAKAMAAAAFKKRTAEFADLGGQGRLLVHRSHDPPGTDPADARRLAHREGGPGDRRHRLRRRDRGAGSGVL